MMMFVTAIQWQWADQLPYGYNVWQRDKFTVGCNNNWYKILLFYHMFDKRGGECMDVLWYVQLDMILFVFLPFVVWLFDTNRLYGLYSALVPVIVALIFQIPIAVYYEIKANNSFSPGYRPTHYD